MIARRASGSRSIWSIESPTRPNDRFGHVARLPLRVGHPKPAAGNECEGQDDRDRGDQPEEEPVEDRWCRRGRLRRRQDTGVARRRTGAAAAAGPGPPARAETRRQPTKSDDHEHPTDQDDGAGPQARPDLLRGDRGAAGLLLRLAASRRVDPDQAEQDAETGGQSNGKHLTDDRAAGTSERRRSASQGEAALVIPTIAASRKPTTTTAATGSLPHSGPRLSLDHALAAVLAHRRRSTIRYGAARRRRPVSAAETACRRARAAPAP